MTAPTFVFNSCVSFPVSCFDIKQIFDRFCEEDEVCNTHLSFKDRITYLDTLYRVKSVVGYHPYLQKKIRSARIKRNSDRCEQKYQRSQHNTRQQLWLDGGREEHYLAKYGRFGGDHAFLNNAITRITGMATYDIEESWDTPEIPKWLARESKPKPWRCDLCHDTAFACREGFCITLLWCVEPKEQAPVPHRSIMLLYKIRALQRALRKCGSLEIYNADQVCNNAPVKNVKVQPEMEEPHHEMEADTIKTGNVVLTEENASVPVETDSSSNSTIWNSMSSSELDTSYQYLMNRFTLAYDFEWKTTDARNTELGGITLPNVFVFDKEIPDGTMPMFLPFKIFQYFRSDIEIKIHLNSNKFQIGQLQVSWMYMMNYMENISSFKNVHYCSQLPHTVISAGSSNEVTLYIPYKYINAYMNTRARPNGLIPLAMGYLRILVLSPLKVSASGPTSCYGSSFIRFPNCAFTGMRDGGIKDEYHDNYVEGLRAKSRISGRKFVQPEMMEAAATMAGISVVDKLIGDRNCDKPSSTNVPAYLVPTASHSWSLGTGITEPLHNLRLNGQTIGVGRTGIDNSETMVGVPARTFGLCTILEWSKIDGKKNTPGTCLWCVDAHPQLDKKFFNATKNTGYLTTYNVPPVTVVSSLYQQWRGSLEFRFDFVCSQFHTGRLLLAYIPGVADKDCKVTINQARNSPHVVFSLQDSNTVTFKVPYISDKPWWYRKYCGAQRRKEESAPSKFYMFILNPLITMESVSPTIEIVVYVRGGDDFEVSVPVQPAIGLGYNNTNIIKDSKKVRALDGHFPWRVTDWNGFGASKVNVGYYGSDTLGSACMFYEDSDVVRSLATDEFLYYKVAVAQNAPTIFVSDTAEEAVGFLVMHNMGQWVMGIPFGISQEKMAQNCAVIAKSKPALTTLAQYAMPYFKDGKESTGNPLYTPIKWKRTSNRQGDERFEAVSILDPVQNLASTQFGNFTYNENFRDMKDLLRRYQLLAQKCVVVPKGTPVKGEAILQFPSIPGGLDLAVNDDSTNIWNNLRDGALPIIMDGYVFFRGSMRYRLVFSSDSTKLQGTKIWVQHHPDQTAGYGRVVRLKGQIPVEDMYQNHNYGFYIQSMDINSIVELEVPFYQQGLYGLATRYNPSFNMTENDILDYVSLGDVVVGAVLGVTDANVDVCVQIYHSIGDDFSLSCFKGFQSVVFCDEIFEKEPDRLDFVMVQGEMFSGFMGGIASGLVGSLTTTRAGKPLVQSLVDDVAMGVSENLTPVVNEAKESLLATKDELMGNIKHVLETSVITNALGNLMHILANPTCTTVAIAICNVLGSFLMGSIEILMSLKDALLSFFTRFWDSFNAQATAAYENITRVGRQSGCEWFESDELRAVLSIVFTCVAAIVGYRGKEPSSYFNTLRNVAITTSLTTNILNFLKAIADVMGRFTRFCIGMLNPKARLEMLIEGENLPDVLKWFDEVQYLLDARIKAKLTYDRQLMDRVFDAAAFGSILVTNNLHKSNPAAKVIWDLYRDICQLRNDMIERGAHPDVRFECFPLWICGAAGVGKSFLATSLSMDLLESVNYQSKSSPIYYICPGLKHWSGCLDPAVLISDDAFQVKGQNQEEELANLFKICSSSVLNPPMASIADKERRLNPLLYLIFCNYAFPDLSAVMTHSQAVFRRRKFLIDVDFTDDIKARFPGVLDASMLPKDEMTNFRHLKFCFAHDPREPETGWGNPMTYQEMMAIVIPRFQQHYRDERNNFNNRMRNMYRLDPNFRGLDLIEEIPILGEQTSLREQRRLFNEEIRAEMADIDDPFREEEPFVRKFMERFKRALKYQMDDADYNYDHARPGCSHWPDDLDDIDMSNALEWDSSFDFVANPIEDITIFIPEEDNTDYFTGYLYCKKNKKLIAGTQNYEDLDKTAGQIPPNLEMLTPMQALERTIMMNKISMRFARDLFEHCEPDRLLVKHMMLFSVFATGGTITHMDVNGIGGVRVNKMGPQITLQSFLGRFDISGAFESVIQDEDLPELSRKLYIVDYKDLKELLIKTLHNAYQQERAALLLKAATSPGEFEQEIRKLTEQDPTGIVFRFMILTLRGKNPTLDTEQMTVEEVAEAIHGNPTLRDELRERLEKYYSFLNSLIGASDQTCRCHRRYMMILKNMEKTRFYWDGGVGEYVYSNYLGLKEKHDICTHDNSICSNNVFKYLLGCYYNYIHKDEIARGICHSWDRRHNMVNVHVVEQAKHWFEYRKKATIRWWHQYVAPEIGGILTYILEYIPIILAILVYLAGIFGICYAAGKTKEVIVSVFNGQAYTPEGDNAPTFSPEGHNYFKFDTNKPQAKPTTKVTPKSFSAQSVGTHSKVTHNKVQNNTVLLHGSYVENGKRMIRSGRCLMLCGKRMLVLRHYLEEFADMYRNYPDITFQLYFNINGKSSNLTIYPQDLFKDILWSQVKGNYMKSNFGIVTLPKYVPSFKTILNIFATKAMHNNLTTLCDFISVGGNSLFDMPIEVKTNYTVEESSITTEVIMDSVYTYKNQGKGLCGSVLISNPLCGGNGGIVGIHVAGCSITGEGVAEPIYREMLEEALGLCVEKEPEVIDMPLEPLEKQNIVLDSNLMLYGCVPAKFAHRESGKTKIVPSVIQNMVYPVTSEPNPLLPDDPRQPAGSHPLRDGCQKHGSGSVIPFSPIQFENSVSHVSNRLLQIIQPVRAIISPLTPQQACCGDTEVPYFEPLNWKTSEGFPLKSMRPSDQHDKRWLFNLTETKDGYLLDGFNPLLQNQLDVRDKCFQTNTKPTTVYEDCLKDCRLPKEKCKIPGKTRIFSIAPIACTIDVKTYLGDFCASFKNTRIENSCGIGINPDSLEWTHLAHYLFDVGDKIITLDYSNFGPCLMSQAVQGAIDIVVNWHKHHGAAEEHVARVKWLLECDIINPVHLADNVIYQTINGIASGSPVTGEINSLSNLLYVYNIWYEIMKDKQSDWADFYYFDMYVRFVVYGDDLIMSVSDDVCEFFNAITIHEYFKKHGITVTPAQKDNELQKYGSLYDATFLKRGFLEHPSRYGIFLAPVEVNSIRECLNWVTSSNDIQDATLQNCVASLDLAYGHGPKFYEEHLNKILKALNKVKLTLNSKSWNLRDSEIFGDSVYPEQFFLQKLYPWNEYCFLHGSRDKIVYVNANAPKLDKGREN